MKQSIKIGDVVRVIPNHDYGLEAYELINNTYGYVDEINPIAGYDGYTVVIDGKRWILDSDEVVKDHHNELTDL
jgi:hypothetical protein